jgi:hypothetical protein
MESYNSEADNILKLLTSNSIVNFPHYVYNIISVKESILPKITSRAYLSYELG